MFVRQTVWFFIERVQAKSKSCAKLYDTKQTVETHYINEQDYNDVIIWIGVRNLVGRYILHTRPRYRPLRNTQSS